MCDRTMDGEVIEFGTSGYTMDNTFVLYDRKTDSVWYPLTEGSFDAVAGPAKGVSFEFIAKPEVMRLHEWAAEHPDTLVLLPPPPSPEQQRAMDRRRELVGRLRGTWEMSVEQDGRTIESTMVIAFHDGEVSGVWTSDGETTELSGLRFNGERIRFSRRFPDGRTWAFTGVVEDGKISGLWTSEGAELPCTGRKRASEATQDHAPASQPGG